jgi:signal transduction histidine kinase
LTEGQQRALDTMESQISKLARLVVHLLDTMRLESRMLIVEPEDADLGVLVRAVVEQHRPASDSHTFTVTGPEHLRARIDPLRIEQVLTNLLDNAVKFSPDGGAVEVGIEPRATTAVITVRDHGIGVTPEHRTRVFDRFYQAHPNRSGLGIGLYISRHIVELHGGMIYAEFPSDGGTRFVVSLPLVAVPPVRLTGAVAAD